MNTPPAMRPLALLPDSVMSPCMAEITSIKPEADGVATFTMRIKDPALRAAYRFEPGQFNMLYLPGYGEAAISISSDPGVRGEIAHTIRFVGNVTRAMNRLKMGDCLGVRGPFGTAWPVQAAEGMDVVVASGGIGLAPLRPALYHLIRYREKYGKVILIYGARTPRDLLFTSEFEAWKAANIEVHITVDRADEQWQGQVGVVPMLFYRFRVDPHRTMMWSCGPEVMMRFVVFEGLARRVPADRIYLSLERNMKCGQGSCGHCQLGPFFICKDGPVFSFDALEPYFDVEEL